MLKRIVLLTSCLLIMALIFGLVGCAPPEEKEATPPETGEEVKERAETVEEDDFPLAGMAIKKDGTPLHVGYMANEVASEWMTVNTGFTRSLIERAGGKFTLFNADGDAAKEIDGLEDMIELKPDAIILHPVSSYTTVPGVERATKEGIRCYSVDIRVLSDDIVTHVGLSQERMGEMAAEALVNHFGDQKVNILEIQGMLGMELAEPRNRGFKRIVDQHDNMEIVASYVCDWRNELSMDGHNGCSSLQARDKCYIRSLMLHARRCIPGPGATWASLSNRPPGEHCNSFNRCDTRNT